MSLSIETLPRVCKRGGKVEEFKKSKIERGIQKSAEDIGQDINGKFENLIESIINEAVVSSDDGVIGTEAITDIVKRKLMDYQYHEVAEAFILYSNKQAKQHMEPDVGMMADYVTMTRYSRYRADLQRREVFGEIVDRVEAMHLNRYPEIQEELKWAFDKVRAKEVLPSMRSMQFGGKAIEANHAKGYNCSFSVCNHPRFFSEALWLLLSGTGTGFSVQFQHIDALPDVQFVNHSDVKHFVIPDSIKGWAEAANQLIQSYLVTGKYVEFSYHKIRQQGKPLKTSGGKAPGHLPLKKALDRVRTILEEAQGRQLKPIDAYDIMCMLADAVYDGGLREAAMICLFSLDDGEMMNSKTGNWHKSHPWRARCNNSVVLQRSDIKKRQYDRIFRATKQWGEPGFYFTDDEDSGANPCVEIGLNPKLTITPLLKHELKQWAKKTKRDIPNLKVNQVHWGWQMCVAGDTRLITKSGITSIEESLGEEIEIWNGSNWANTTPFITGHNRKLYRVKFSDGSYLDCTDNHKFLVADRFGKEYSEVETKDLLDFSKYAIHVPRANITCIVGKPHENMYEYGFFLADGYLHDHGCLNHKGTIRPEAKLFGKKINLPLVGSRYGDDKIYFKLDINKCKELKDHTKLPKWLFKLDKESILNFVAGWADGDGSKTTNGCRIYANEGRIRDLQLLLTKIGINASVNKAYDKGETAMLPNGRSCIRNRSVWYAQICGYVPTNRFECNGIASTKNKWQIVRSVKELPGSHITYCLEEADKHQCLFNNVITKQCNLTEVNVSTVSSVEELYDRVRAAAIIGTAQAGYTDFDYLGWTSEAICNREALLGVSMTGIMDNPDIALSNEIQRTAAQLCVETNVEIALKIGINTAARVTCVKPSGSASIVLGAVGSGIHTHHAKKYFRRVRANPDCPIYKHFKELNPHMCQSVDPRKDLITFPIKAPDSALTRRDLTASEFLKAVLTTQQNWVMPGTTRPSSSPGVNHNVSNTITVKENEWEIVREFIWKHRSYFSGISMLADIGDKAYTNAPREEVRTESDETRWQDLIYHAKQIDWSDFNEDDDNTTHRSEKACAGGACQLV